MSHTALAHVESLVTPPSEIPWLEGELFPADMMHEFGRVPGDSLDDTTFGDEEMEDEHVEETRVEIPAQTSDGELYQDGKRWN
eukprot:6057636-Amphidinium_carterae.1